MKIDKLANTIDLVGVGLNATDTVIALDRYPAQGAKLEFNDLRVLPGGQVASTVAACQQWGLTTRYIGKLGDDAAAELHRREFARLGVDAKLIAVPYCSSRQSVILVDGDGERTVLWRRDQRQNLHPNELRREWIESARVLHLDGYDMAAATLAASWARAAGIPVVADLDELYPGIDDLLALTDYAIVSRDFPLRLTGEPTLEAALQTMQRRYQAKLTAATLGHDGALAWDGQQFCYSSAFRVPVADTTGAGDIFHAGFIYALLQGWPLQRQLDFSGAAAALNCTAIGARGGIRPVQEIEALMLHAERHPAIQSYAEVTQGSSD
uniref:PfkB domain protein n=1 Tax=mine drainage metagenome TaxID=410659 RepID=E6QHV6_9ZZZZ